MYKLLIADDEAVEREALSDLAHELFKDSFEIALAENGKNAVDIAETFAPDIALMDIKMPRMNGIDAAKLILEKYPDCKVIMLTGFTYFNYAKDSVSLGALDFLVKPASDETVEKALKAAIKAVDAVRSINRKGDNENSDIVSSQKLERELVSEILFSGADKNMLISMISELYPQVKFGAAAIVTVKYNNYESERIFSAQFRDFCFEAVQKSALSAFYTPLCRRRDRFYIAMLSDNQQNKRGYEKFATCLLSVLAQNGISATISIGSITQDISNLPMGFIEARNVRLKNENIGWFSSDLFNAEKSGDMITQERKLCAALDQKQFDNARLLLEYMLDSILESNTEVSIRIYELLLILNRKAQEKISLDPSYNLWNSLCRLENSNDRKQVAQHYLQTIIDRLIMEEAADNESWPQEIIDYINIEYKNNITLEDAANKVGFSTYYFSRLFKQKFDKPFIEYLTQLRIEKAKQLLSSPGVSVKTVCYSVGYSEPNYFARVFKRETGMSPSKFQKKVFHTEE